jgi:hypothetical protein
MAYLPFSGKIAGVFLTVGRLLGVSSAGILVTETINHRPALVDNNQLVMDVVSWDGVDTLASLNLRNQVPAGGAEASTAPGIGTNWRCTDVSLSFRPKAAYHILNLPNHGWIVLEPGPRPPSMY